MPTEEELYAQFQEEEQYQQFLRESGGAGGADWEGITQVVDEPATYKDPFGGMGALGSATISDEDSAYYKPAGDVAMALAPWGRLVGKLPAAANAIKSASAIPWLGKAVAPAVDAFSGSFANLGLDYLAGGDQSTEMAVNEGLIGTAAGTALNPIFKGLGSLFRRGGNYVDDIYNKERALNSAFSTSVDDFIPAPGKLPLNEALKNAVGDGLIDPKVMAASREPFSDLNNQLFSRANGPSVLDFAGKDVDGVLARTPGTIPYKKLNAGNILPDDEIAARTASRIDSIASGQTARDTELFQRAEGISPEVVAASNLATSSDPTKRMLAEARGFKAEQLAPKELTAPEAIARARAFSDPANWGNVASSPEADIFRSLDGATRREVGALASSAGLGDEFSAANQKYRTLSTLQDPIARRAAQELQAVQGPSVRGYASLANPIKGLRGATVGDPVSMGNPTRKYLNIAAGDTLGQKTGFDQWGSGGLRGAGAGLEGIADSGLMSKLPTLWGETAMEGPRQPPQMPNIVPPAMADDGRPEGVKLPVMQSYMPDERPGNVPRHVGAVDPRMIGSFINQFVPPQDIQPLAVQAMRVFAMKDQRETARFVSALADKYPDIPFERGPITGLPSEWQLDDGTTKLFSQFDVQKWTEEIENSPLREDEKAQRLRALRTDGTVYPLDRKLNDFGPPILADSAMNAARPPDQIALEQMMSTQRFTPRVPTPFGSAKVQ